MKATSLTSLSISQPKSKSKKRKKQIGCQILETRIPHYNVCSTSKRPNITHARDFISREKIKTNAVITVTRGNCKDKFYWSGKGMYSMQYAAINYLAFPELRQIAIDMQNF